MYRDFFGFSEKPFNLTPDPDFLYLSRSHKEALAHLTYGVESKSGFVLVTGEVGAGKTTLLRTLIRNLGESVLLSQVSNTRVSYKELLEMILRDFGLHPGDRGKTELLGMLNDFLIEKYREGKNCILLIDEAQNLAVPTLEGVRMLSNLETEKAKLLHTILVGQPGLRDLIDSPDLEQLRQRISVRYHLGPLSVNEVGEYIRHRLAKVRQDPEKSPVFSDEIIPKIHEATGGLPRLINALCDAALLHAYVADSRDITSEVLSSAAGMATGLELGSKGAVGASARGGINRVDDRIAQLETKLNALMSDAARVSMAGASPHRLAERANQLVAKEKSLREREAALERRAEILESRERELTERVLRVREEWKRRVERLERTRRELAAGGIEARFPSVSVQVFEPDPLSEEILREALESAGLEVDSHPDFEAFLRELREASRSGCFGIAVLGSVNDDPVNVERVATLTEDLPHVPVIYLSDLDFSSIRRRFFGAGATFFIEKPSLRNRDVVPNEVSAKLLKSDLLRAVDKLVTQQRAIFGHLLAEVSELPMAKGQ